MRFDIQFWRGLAVLLVVLSHAFPQWFPDGFVGVDIFFVISGYLMTKMIVGGIDRGDFTFGSFYLRRARRLIPASLTTVGVTIAVAALVLPSEAWPGFAISVAAVLTFTANFITQAQMFGNHVMQPLSHFWSLSLEEQFYFVYPVLLFALPRRTRLPVIAALMVASFAIWMVAPVSIRFYHLPARAWELLLGGLIFLTPGRIPDTWLPRLSISNAMAKLGDWSYSLYLVHWPLLAFAAIIVGSPLPPVTALAICVLSIALAALQYRFIEQPWRRKGHSQLRQDDPNVTVKAGVAAVRSAAIAD